MSTLYDADIAGDAEVSITPGYVIYVLVWLYTLGPTVRDGDVGSSQIMRAGWWTIGLERTDILSSSAIYWHPIVYLNFIRTIWQPEPAVSDTFGSQTVYATHLKWHLSPGTNGHIFASGT